jgi:Retroviral aspartyl protease.
MRIQYENLYDTNYLIIRTYISFIYIKEKKNTKRKNKVSLKLNNTIIMKLDCHHFMEFLHDQLQVLEKNLEEFDLYHQEETEKDDDLVPTTLIIPLKIQNVHNDKLMICLLDSGASDTIISRRDRLPTSVVPKVLQSPIRLNTLLGQQKIKTYVQLEDIILPEFPHSYKIEQAKAYVIDSTNCNYDLIIGRDFLRKNKIHLSFEDNTISWLNEHVKMKPNQFWHKRINWYHSLLSTSEQHEDLLNESHNIERQHQSIKHSKYESTKPEEVIELQKHLNQNQKQQLLNILTQYPVLFSGRLGKYPHQRIHLDTYENIKPFHAKPYAVPYIHQQVFKDELQRLCTIGVLERCGRSEWGAGTFIIPKKAVESDGYRIFEC